MICGTFFYPLVSALKYIFSPLKDKVRNLTRITDFLTLFFHQRLCRFKFFCYLCTQNNTLF